ncbi:MAG: DUF1015 domain-containing protein [Lachnospiraceae bacterium]|nr:DUF1015 domain-containing protein [Lachnospiraceae bacterium]
MATVIPFSCVRPAADLAHTVAALPYDVYSGDEARDFVASHPRSFLAIDRPETAFPKGTDMYSAAVYEKAAELLNEWMQDGTFLTDSEHCYYLYELTMNGRTQTGIVACVSIDDYINGVVKKHENTRADKEEDRVRHVTACAAQTGPIFLAYRAREEIRTIVDTVKQTTPLYDFTSEDGIRHRVFRIADTAQIVALQSAFSGMNRIYIADGHHRAASAVRTGLKRREEDRLLGTHTGKEEYNYFLSVLFPDEELMIMDYNRVIKELNGFTEETFFEKVNEVFEVTELSGCTKPAAKGEFTMFFRDQWFLCKIKASDYAAVSSDPVASLDVSLLQNLLLDPVLGIKDPRTDKRIDFVGGIRGLSELERRCHTDCKVAFALYPTSIQELFDVADAGLLMPPKSTWFEPKLRSGLFLHQI